MRGASPLPLSFLRRLPLLLMMVGAVVADAAAERLPIRAYTTENGLAHNRVKRIVQDSRGFLWFCTADGLSRFDGYQFTNFRVEDGLPAPSINDLLEMSDGVYWIATNSAGVARLDLRAGTATGGQISQPRFTHYPISRHVAANRVNVLYRDRTAILWAGTDGGLFRIDEAGRNKVFDPVPLAIPSHPDVQVQVSAIVEDTRGNLWIGTRYGLVRRSTDGQLSHYRPPSPDDDSVLALLAGSDGSLWVGHRAGLTRLDPGNVLPLDSERASVRAMPREAHHYSSRDGLTDDTVLSVRQAADGRIWIRTSGAGLTMFDGRSFRSYRVGQQVADSIGSLSEDREGNLWLGTNALGALKISINGWITYGQDDGLGESVSAIFENRAGELYVTSSGWRISRFDGRGHSTVRPGFPKSVTDASWRDMSGVVQDRSGQWWMGTREGLYRFASVSPFEQLAHARPLAVYTMRDGLSSNDVSRVFEDSRGDIWIGYFVPAGQLLTRWERATGTFHHYGETDGLQPYTTVNAFAEDRSSDLWVGFREGGLARYRPGGFLIVARGDGLPAGGVNGLHVDGSGRLWVAHNQGGLSRIDAPGADRPRVVVYTRAHGLASDVVLSVTGDLAGRIYIATNRGIDRLDPQTGRIKHYSRADGFAPGEFKSALRDRGGALWFCTTAGLSRVVPEADHPLSPPPVLISAVHVAGVQRAVSALGEKAISLPRLGRDESNIQIDFFGMDLRAGESPRYQYRLEPASQAWSPPSALRSVNYANLAPGTYRFHVRAVSADGTPSPSPATVAFEILPPIWLRWWFLGTATLLLAGGAGAVARARHRRLQALRRTREERLAELERVRTRIATDLHDDIGSNLTRISLLSEVVRQRLGPTEAPLAEPLSSIAGLSRELVDTMSDIVWAINPHKDHLSDLSQRMRHFASDVFTARQISFRFRTPDAGSDIALGANVRREIFLMFKEAVNNIVRHSGCSEASLDFDAEPDGLVLRVADNGRGFEAGHATDGHGLASMRERAASLGGQLEVLSTSGRGTTLTFRIPVAGGAHPMSPHDGFASQPPHDHAVTTSPPSA